MKFNGCELFFFCFTLPKFLNGLTNVILIKRLFLKIGQLYMYLILKFWFSQERRHVFHQGTPTFCMSSDQRLISLFWSFLKSSRVRLTFTLSPGFNRIWPGLTTSIHMINKCEIIPHALKSLLHLYWTCLHWINCLVCWTHILHYFELID